MIQKGIDEQKVYKEFLSLAREIKVPVIDMHYELELVKDTQIIDKIERTRCHSFNRNAFNWMFMQLGCYPCVDSSFGASYISIKDTSDTIRTSATYGVSGGFNAAGASKVNSQIDDAGFGYNGAVGIDTLGIVVGTGVGAESFDGYILTTKVAHGNGAGQLHYADTVTPTVAWDDGANTMTSTFIRYLNNNSGGQIDITEIGIYAYAGFTTTASYRHMITRDLLVATIEMVDASQLKVTYEVDLIYPE